nr:MAG TPA: hypothetical protein [Caudoviricetes sp.]
MISFNRISYSFTILISFRIKIILYYLFLSHC